MNVSFVSKTESSGSGSEMAAGDTSSNACGRHTSAIVTKVFRMTLDHCYASASSTSADVSHCAPAACTNTS